MARLMDTRHKMTHLPITSSVMARLSRPSPRGATSAAVHASAPLAASVRLSRLLHKPRHMDWRDSKGPDLKNKAKIEKIGFGGDVTGCDSKGASPPRAEGGAAGAVEQIGRL
jgi:hypothetical protein